MNEGIISARYAKALLKFVQETGAGDKVYSQAGVLVLRLKEIRELKDYIQNHDEISMDRKLRLLEAALGEPMAEELTRFVLMVNSRRRIDILLRMLYSFISQYRAANNIKAGRLVTALPAEGLKERLEDIFHDRTGAQVLIETKVNPEILGGFIFELDDWRLDASVESRFREISRKLIDNNKKLF